MKISYGKNVYGKEEIKSVTQQLNKSTQMGSSVRRFEEKVSSYFSKKYALMVNSGSSANLIGVSAMKLYHKLNLKDGDEFIAPGIGWSTSYSPFIQNNLNVRFVDVEKYSMNIDPRLIEKNINKKTKGILAINILGNPCEYEKILNIAKKFNLLLVEDNCESLGATYKRSKYGSYGLCS